MNWTMVHSQTFVEVNLQPVNHFFNSTRLIVRAINAIAQPNWRRAGYLIRAVQVPNVDWVDESRRIDLATQLITWGVPTPGQYQLAFNPVDWLPGTTLQFWESPDSATPVTPTTPDDVIELVNQTGEPFAVGSPLVCLSVNSGYLAQADTLSNSEVIGFAVSAIAPGTSGLVKTDGLLIATIAQWDAVIGNTGGLVPGWTYYLSADLPGRITSIIPVVQGEYLVRLGKALSPTSLEISISPPIGL